MLASISVLLWPSTAVLLRLEARVLRAGDDVREVGRLEVRTPGCRAAVELAAAAAAAAARRSSKLAELCSSSLRARSRSCSGLGLLKAAYASTFRCLLDSELEGIMSIETGVLSGLVSLRVRTEPARLRVRLRVDMAGLEVCTWTEGVEGEEVPRCIMLEERLALGSKTSSTVIMSPRTETEGDGSESYSPK